MERSIVVLGVPTDHRTNHNQPNPKSPPEVKDITDPYFYTPLAIVVAILTTFVCFLIYRRKQSP